MDRRIIVVGGGLAGWTAATAAREGGAAVTLVERSASRPAFSNSVLSGGVLHAALLDPSSDPATLSERLTALTEGHADPDVVAAWAEHAARTIAWLKAQGATLEGGPGDGYRAAVFAPVKPTTPGTDYAGRGTPNFLALLQDRFTATGGQLIQPARAVGLAPTGGKWRLDLADGRQLTADAVILANGGVQGDPDLVRRHIGTDRLKLRAADGSTGDGLRMGLANGAVAVNMDGFYGHLLHREAATRDELWPYPIFDILASAGIVVDQAGGRIVDETIGGVMTTNAVARAADPLGCWLIVDDAGWGAEGRWGMTPPFTYLAECGVPPVTAPTLEALAAQVGIDPAGLGATVADVMRDPASASPARSAAPKMAQPPFHAIPLIAGISFTLGGLRVDGHARCLDADGRVITGLYAAGGTMGGLHGGPRLGYAGGLLEAAIFGLLAGEDAARA